MATEYVKNAYKIKIGRHRTLVQTCENMPLQKTQPIKKGKSKKTLPTIPSNYAGFNYYKRMKRRRAKIKELCWNNFKMNYTTMLTLTYDTRDGAQQYTDLEKSHYEFKKFIQRVNSHYDNFKYLTTFSRQNNGNWHYHVMCNFDHSVTNSMVFQLWQKGFTYVSYIKDADHFRSAIKYLTNNMTEVAEDLKGKRGYLYSANMEPEIELKSWNNIAAEEYNEVFEKVADSQKKILYESRNHLGIKGERVNEETGEVFEVTILDREIDDTLRNAGYDSWDTVYTYVSSSADFSDKFKALESATLKPKKWKKAVVLKKE